MYCSDEVYRIFGLKPQLGITFDAYFNYIHPDDRDLIIDSVKEILKGKPYSIDNRIITANGEERIIHSNAEIIFDENNIPVYAKGIVQDVTESRQAEKALQENEARFRNLFETMPSGVVIYDVIDEGRDFIFKDINSAGERIDQVRKENIIGKSLYELFPNVSEMRLDEVFRRVWLTGKPEFFPVTLYKDERIALWVTNHIYRLSSGELVAVFDDITERKKAEESLARIEIARKQEIHHRIKNNLQVISSLLDLQAEQFRNRECIKDSEVLEAFRESQHRVISMALIHEELYKGGEFETLNLAPYIKELTQNLFQTYSLGNSDIRLNIDLAENTFFDMDIAVPLGMIVNELVSNSLKYAFIGRDKGEIRIRLVREESLQLKNQDCESTIFILTVSDNGVGIAENINIKNLDTLGMQLVTSLVNQLDGEFGLKRDNGTEFIIRFTVKER
jgi:PAS domain S-box-containing protein